ncbi:hypothetical protein VA596_47425 [Amycolatopsis sp., V23-08]|uniref:Uncharacterized protein n=1 Tax=Amycolatopsis heterodermiae TaxID=3110235 RepID=A0ABU5RLR2_9PSEU|nr:hypothetical protein [Amycolatopsis sp., V23-08]MEA5367231.1 hypothetical protein [Amycolatopsis sp., V23-08]
MHAYTELICFTPAAFFTTTFAQLVQLSLTFAGTYLGCRLGLKLIGFLGELGEAAIERMRAKSARDAERAEGGTRPTPPKP